MEQGYKNYADARLTAMAGAGLIPGGRCENALTGSQTTIKERADNCEKMLHELINSMDSLRVRVGVHFPEPCEDKSCEVKPDGLSRTVESIEAGLYRANRIMVDLERIA